MITCSQARRNDDVVLFDRVLVSVFSGETVVKDAGETETVPSEDGAAELVRASSPVPTVPPSRFCAKDCKLLKKWTQRYVDVTPR